MNKFIKEQALTPGQYRRANLIMCLILAVSYFVYIIVEIININKFGMSAGLVMRCILYAVMIILSVVTYKIFASRKVECIASLIICVVKCIILFSDGNMELFNYGILICAGLIVGIFGAYITILLLIDFNKEDRVAIENEAEHRAQVAHVVEGIVTKLDTDFRDVVNILQDIDVAMSSADKLKGTVDDGRLIADNLQNHSDIVDQNITRISETINQLVENVQKVSGITQAIENISSQTNLLTLNASIEAARACEAGNGFAVLSTK